MTNDILYNVSFLKLLISAKQNTYASDSNFIASCRPGSTDLAYQEGPFRYLDTYLGEFNFSGEEAVGHEGKTIWGMNYYGRMLVEKIPAGFSHCLKSALLNVPQEIPFRGPEEFYEDDFSYNSSTEGTIEWFRGKEFICYKGQKIYQLYFHGGEIKLQQ